MKLLFAFLCASALLLATGCQFRNTPAKASNGVAFIEYYVTVEGTALSGTPPPGMRIDGPTYTFDPQSQSLQSFIAPNFDPKETLAIIGMGRILRGTEGGGLSSRLVGVNQLPRTEGQLTLKTIGKSKIFFDLLGNSYTLEPGMEALALNYVTDTIEYETEKAVIRKTISHQVIYHGRLKQSNINFPSE